MNESLKQIISDAGSQKKLAEDADVSQSMISHVLNGRRIPGYFFSKKLSRFTEDRVPWYRFVEESINSDHASSNGDVSIKGGAA